MKKLMIASLMMVGVSVANAEVPKYAGADSSELTKICLAATESLSAMRMAISESKEFNQFDVETIACNGLPIKSFAARQQTLKRRSITLVPSLNPANDSPETALCMAAVTSSERFQQLRQESFGDVDNVAREIRCNGMSLNSFVLKYSSAQEAPSLSLR